MKDLDDLYQLSLLENFLNLPQNRTLLGKKIEKSLQSFKSLDQFDTEKSFLFVLVDSLKNKVIGCSNLHAQHGTKDKPHYYLKIEEETKTSPEQSLKFTHRILKLGIETEGYSEIGGLVLDPNYRGHNMKLGKQISFTRFHFISLFPHLFTELIHTELLPPFSDDGSSPLWEELGRKFFNMGYIEADILSRTDKQFITNLFPSESIYVKLLSQVAQDCIGAVGESTALVKRMLEKIGFQYTSEIDPFDGGPHYRANKNSIHPVKNARLGDIKFEATHHENQLFLFNQLGSFEFTAATAFYDSKKEAYILAPDSKSEFEKINFLEKQTYSVIPL